MNIKKEKHETDYDLIYIKQRDPEIAPTPLSITHEFHTESRSTPGCYSEDHLPDPHGPHVDA